MSTEVQLSFDFPTPVFRLTAADREIKALLGRLAGRHGECWHSTASIAQRLGVTLRAAQLRIDRLIKNGFLERVWDYSLNTRRRLVLLWRGTSSVSAEPCVEPTRDSAPVDAAPKAEEAVVVHAEPVPSPVEARKETQVTPEVREWIAETAKSIVGDDPALAAIAVAAARKHGPVVAMATLADMSRLAAVESIRDVGRCFWGFANMFLSGGMTALDPRVVEAEADQADRDYWHSV